MIVEFNVSNFRSIFKKQTFSMVASVSKGLENNICNSDCDDKLPLVRAAVLYGANASGKSNLLSALLLMRKLIISSAKESQQGEVIPVDGFFFNKKNRNKPCEFEVTFIKDKTRFQYGFSANKKQILEEWLFAYPLGKAQKWFSRVYDSKEGNFNWNFSKFFKGNKQRVIELTRDNVLFLSNAVKLNNEQLFPVFEWFQKDLILLDPLHGTGLNNQSSSTMLLKTEENKKRLLKFMQAADPSIIDINVEKIKPDEEELHFPDSMPKEVRDFFTKEFANQERARINFIHIGNIPIDLREESDGTLRLLAYAGRWIDALDNGRTIVVDELDNSLHPLLVRALIKLICNPETNKKNAQLIFSTHDTSLLDNELFRRDQIWFVEKDEINSTQLHPLLEFSPRKHEAFGKGYLQGRYGALPYIGEWKF